MMGESAGRSRNHPVGEGAQRRNTPAERRGSYPVMDEKMSAGTKGRIGLWVVLAIVGAVMVLGQTHSIVSVVGLALVIASLAAASLENRWPSRR